MASWFSMTHFRLESIRAVRIRGDRVSHPSTASSNLQQSEVEARYSSTSDKRALQSSHKEEVISAPSANDHGR
jgi:hypothetical protein